VTIAMRWPVWVFRIVHRDDPAGQWKMMSVGSRSHHRQTLRHAVLAGGLQPVREGRRQDGLDDGGSIGLQWSRHGSPRCRDGPTGCCWTVWMNGGSTVADRSP
jgi:hypothetical protein